MNQSHSPQRRIRTVHAGARLRFVAFAALLSAAAAIPGAGAATVNAALSREVTSVGQPVTLQVQVEGASDAELPQEISADGLQIRLTGRSTQVSIINMKMTTSGVYSYTVFPERAGDFTIPAIPVRVGGKSSRTPEFKLTVKPGAAPAVPPAITRAPSNRLPGSAQPATPSDPNREVAFAELVVPKKTAYVGEVVPVEIQLYFDPRYSPKATGRPVFGGDGFTVAELSDPERSEKVIDGIPYIVFTIQSAITPLKAGELEIPAVSLDCVVRTGRSSLPSDVNDLFRQMMGSAPPGFGEEQEITVKSDSVRLSVKPLPKAGRPKNFSGAVGEFSITSNVSPAKAAPGDPVTLRVEVHGRGNFKGMGDPVLTDTEGWRLYPPSSKFEAADRIGFGGTKTFENMLVAQQDQTRTPGVEFSYFDPVKEKYVTLTADPLAVQAAASQSSAPAASPQRDAATNVAAAPSPESPASGAAATVLDSFVPRSFEPLLYDRTFLIANGAAAAAVVALLALQIIRHAQSGEGARRQRELRNRVRALAALERSALSDAEFLDQARQWLLAEIERATGSTLGTLDTLCEARQIPDDRRAELAALLDRADELKYGGGVSAALSTLDRRRILHALREVGRA